MSVSVIKGKDFKLLDCVLFCRCFHFFRVGYLNGGEQLFFSAHCCCCCCYTGYL